MENYPAELVTARNNSPDPISEVAPSLHQPQRVRVEGISAWHLRAFESQTALSRSFQHVAVSAGGNGFRMHHKQAQRDKSQRRGGDVCTDAMQLNISMEPSMNPS